MLPFLLYGLHSLRIESDEWGKELLKDLSLRVSPLSSYHLIGRRPILLVGDFDGFLHGPLMLCAIFSCFLRLIDVDYDTVLRVVRTLLLLIPMQTHVS